MYFRRSSSSTMLRSGPAPRRRRSRPPSAPDVGQVEEEVLQQGREHGVQPARADVLHAVVERRGGAGDRLDPVVGEGELRALGLDQRLVLREQRVLRLLEDADEVASVRFFSSTRIGKRPCSSGIRSDGLETWKAPAATKRMWSVRTIPYFVCTVEPSTIGSRSRWTPSRETSGPAPPRSPAILSISSRKTIPLSSARSSASLITSSMLTSLSSSSWSRMRRASATVTCRRLVFFGRRSCSIS
jgi:hypothetical protein